MDENNVIVLLPIRQHKILEIDRHHKRVGQSLCTRRFLDRLYHNPLLGDISEKRWHIDATLLHRGKKVGYVVTIQPLKGDDLPMNETEQQLAQNVYWLPIHFFYHSVKFPMSSIEAPFTDHSIAVALQERLRHFLKKSRTYSISDWSALEHVAWKIVQCTCSFEWIMTHLVDNMSLIRGQSPHHNVVVDIIIYTHQASENWSIPLWSLFVMVYEQHHQNNIAVKEKKVSKKQRNNNLWQQCIHYFIDWIQFLATSISLRRGNGFETYCRELIQERKLWLRQAYELEHQEISDICQKIKTVFQEAMLPRDGFIVMVNDYYVKIGKIARYIRRDLMVDGQALQVGHICICSKALKNRQYLIHILAHELVHAAIPNNRGRHDKQFQQIATAIGIPQRMQK